MFKRSVISRLLFCALVSLPVPAFAISQLTISSPSCDGVFLLQGNLQGVAALDILISYDQSTLDTPQVIPGNLVNGMMFASNPNGNPIHIGVVGATKAATGAGTVATLTFRKVGASAGQINTLVVKQAIDSNGQAVPMLPGAIVSTSACGGSTGSGSSSGSTSGTAGDNSAATATGAATGTSNGSGTGTATGTGNNTGSAVTTNGTVAAPVGPYVLGGSVTLPSTGATADSKQAASPQSAQPENDGGQVAAQESAPSYEASRPAAGTAPATKAVDEPAAPAPPVQSVLERFRQFSGEKTVKGLTALFDRDKAATFSQSPAIAIADGKTTLKVTIAKVAGKKAPNFAFNSVQYVSLAKSADGGWEIEVRPEKGVTTASVTLLVDGTLQEIPLTVAPKVEVGLHKGGAPTESDFALFLKERGTEKSPKFDLNGDGKRDYLDDYIFTANYLVKMDEKQKQKQVTQQKK